MLHDQAFWKPPSLIRGVWSGLRQEVPWSHASLMARVHGAVMYPCSSPPPGCQTLTGTMCAWRVGGNVC